MKCTNFEPGNRYSVGQSKSQNVLEATDSIPIIIGCF